jgi:anti-anti-sigma factor
VQQSYDALNANSIVGEVLSLIGEYDMYSSAELASEIDCRLSESGSLCVDFTRCTYVDSSILTLLIRAVKRYGNRLQMIVPSDGNVARLFSVTHLDRVFPIL